MSIDEFLSSHFSIPRINQFRRAPSQLQIENLKSFESMGWPPVPDIWTGGTSPITRGSSRADGTHPLPLRPALAYVRHSGPRPSDVLDVQRHFWVGLDGSGLWLFGLMDWLHVRVYLIPRTRT